MDRMTEVGPGSKSRNLQQFLTHSKWDYRDVIDHVTHDIDKLLGDNRNTFLLIDESGFEKQGKSSVGVSRQWSGRLGKADNGQVEIFGTLANAQYVAPVDVRLYLPQKWANDPKRCERACLKMNEVFELKPNLPWELYGMPEKTAFIYGWIGADAGYDGRGPGFCLALDEMGDTFVVDVHSDFQVCLEDPKPYLPQKN